MIIVEDSNLLKIAFVSLIVISFLYFQFFSKFKIKIEIGEKNIQDNDLVNEKRFGSIRKKEIENNMSLTKLSDTNSKKQIGSVNSLAKISNTNIIKYEPKVNREIDVHKFNDRTDTLKNYMFEQERFEHECETYEEMKMYIVDVLTKKYSDMYWEDRQAHKEVKQAVRTIERANPHLVKEGDIVVNYIGDIKTFSLKNKREKNKFKKC
jgi:hypothetical protein